MSVAPALPLPAHSRASDFLSGGRQKAPQYRGWALPPRPSGNTTEWDTNTRGGMDGSGMMIT